ncbi:MAG: hypothetical protein GF309_15790 [Candidatus Lokiarchaeota archaeon]|nr:hypothetical protein [Candidatus Lokiarchaeota archaeon]
MLLAAIAPLVAWLVFRKKGVRYGLIAFLVVSILVPSFIDYDIRHGDIERYDVISEGEREFSIVYFNSTALFPFLLQKHHNWTAAKFVYQVHFLDHDGEPIFETSPWDDQSEYMHWKRFDVTLRLCGIGILISTVVVSVTESMLWWQKKRIIKKS